MSPLLRGERLQGFPAFSTMTQRRGRNGWCGGVRLFLDLQPLSFYQPINHSGLQLRRRRRGEARDDPRPKVSTQFSKSWLNTRRLGLRFLKGISVVAINKAIPLLPTSIRCTRPRGGLLFRVFFMSKSSKLTSLQLICRAYLIW